VLLKYIYALPVCFVAIDMYVYTIIDNLVTVL